MSIFFDFEVGPSGRRFRRAVDGDRCDIELFLDQEHTRKIFGTVDIGSLMQVYKMSITLPPIYNSLILRSIISYSVL